MKEFNRRVLVSCEHGGNRLPAKYRYLFDNRPSVLDTHRGYDFGALRIARKISAKLSAPLFFSDTSRLLVDLNRSPRHRDLFSEFTRPCDTATKDEILQELYYPYRQDIESAIRELNRKGYPVLHLSIHSFTPALHGQIRHADIGLLYDPARPAETAFCRNLKRLLDRPVRKWSVRRNYPYRGNADGLTTCFRKIFGENRYLGIEIEVNQRLAAGKDPSLAELIGRLCAAVPAAQADSVPPNRAC